MVRPIRGAKGRFNGSVSTGAKNIPIEAPPTVTAPTGVAPPTSPLLPCTITPGMVAMLRQFHDMDAAELREAALYQVDDDALRLLATDQFPLAHERVAMNRNTPPAVLTRLSGSGDVWVRRNVAANPNTPVEVLVRLAVDPENCVAVRVAENPHTPSAVLNDLARRGHADTIRAVVAHPNVPAETLAYLGRTRFGRPRHPEVAYRVAAHPRTPSGTVEGLCRARRADPFFGDLTFAAAGNPATPTRTLERLLADTTLTAGHYELVAANPNLSPATLTRLAADGRHLYQVASNPSTPVEVLERLCDRPARAWVRDELHPRRAVAANPNCDRARLSVLALDPSRLVRDAARSNPHYADLPEHVLTEAALLDL